jgi:hypothetical protein
MQNKSLRLISIGLIILLGIVIAILLINLQPKPPQQFDADRVWQ